MAKINTTLVLVSKIKSIGCDCVCMCCWNSVFPCVNLCGSAAVSEKIMSNFPGLQFQAQQIYVIVLIVRNIGPLIYKKGIKKKCACIR